MFLQILPPENISLVQEIINNKILLFFLITVTVMLPILIKIKKGQSIKTVQIKKK